MPTAPTVRRSKTSAGMLLFRRSGGVLEVLLAHPGGPFWAKKDDHAWSIPKGEFEPGSEEPLAAAVRELGEETGVTVIGSPFALTPVKQPGGKMVHGFALEQDFEPATLVSNTFTMEWPPKTGRLQEFPELDRAQWFPMDIARRKLLSGQLPLLEELEGILSGSPPR